MNEPGYPWMEETLQAAMAVLSANDGDAVARFVQAVVDAPHVLRGDEVSAGSSDGDRRGDAPAGVFGCS
jgi:hypothetical protein